MPDLSLEWGGDFKLSANGDLLLADDVERDRQAIIRRLLTAVRAYIFHQDYGAGLPQKIGSPASVTGITAIIRSQIALEAAVDASKPSSVKVTYSQTVPGLYTIDIGYWPAGGGDHVALSFTP